MASFVLSFFPLDVLDEIWDLIESVSEGFLSYSYISGLLGNRDGSDQSAHIRNLFRLFFFAYHLRRTYIPKTHTGLQKIQKIPINFMWRGIIMRQYPYIKL